MMNNTIIEQVVMSYAIRYQNLSKMVYTEYANSDFGKSEEINVFIDLTKILKTLSTIGNKDVNFIKGTGVTLSAAILNLCAHYKSFFSKGYNTNAHIHLIYSTKEFLINKSLYKDYSYGDVNLISNEKYIDDALYLLDLVCPYLYDVQLNKTSHEPALLMHDILTYHNKEQVPSIVISKDIVNWQLINHRPGVSVFCPSKHNGEDTSYLVNASNLSSAYYSKRKVKSTLSQVPPNLYSLLLALSRVPERNMKSMLSIPFAIKFIYKGLELGAISKLGIILDPANSEAICNIINKEGFKVDPFVLHLRYNAIDLKSLCYSHSLVLDGRYNGYPDLFDPESLEKISNTYYRSNPVDFPTLSGVNL